MTRDFYIVHSHGSDLVRANNAGEALRKAFVPLGYKDARAVVDASLVITGKASWGAFTAIIGTEPALAKGAPR